MKYVAFVDESEPDQRVSPGTYILSAAIVMVNAQDALREHMRGLKSANQKKVHWHDESARGRSKLISSVSALDAKYLVVVRTGNTDARSERRRRLCLERLCYELAARGVERIVFESRGPSDKLDRKLVDSLRAKKP
ncbi:hypothetical protein ADILRU_1286 [Leifsonia rubra CMS 76R]|nr:hypothetical protein ADILRU_1286 [Leifsonia rubra CMS 76R]